MYFACADYAVYSRETDPTIIKNIANSLNPPNALIGLVGGAVFHTKHLRVSSEDDTTFIISQTDQWLPTLTAINSPLQVTLKDSNGDEMTTTFLLPGMSLTHNPQANLSGADFFRLTQLISFRMLDITTERWIDTVAPGLNLPELIANSKKIQDTQIRSTLEEIHSVVSPYSTLPIETESDPLRSALSFNQKQNQILKERSIAVEIAQEIETLQKDTSVITSEKLTPLKQLVISWSAINPEASQQINMRLEKLAIQSRLQLTKLPQNDPFARIISQNIQKTLLQEAKLSSADIYRFFQELTQTTNPKDFNRWLAELYVVSELSKVIDKKNESWLLIASVKAWSAKVGQVIPLIPSSSDQRSNLSNLFSQGNELFAAYISQLSASYFVDKNRPYRIIDRQKHLTNPLSATELSDLSDTVKHLESISSSTKNTWYTISDSYDYSAQDPYKVLTENLASTKDLLVIFQDFGSYAKGKVVTPAVGDSSVDLVNILSQIGITTTPELLDESTKKYRLLDATSSGSSLTYDLVTLGDRITALSIRETSKNIRILDTTGQSRLETLLTFHQQFLPKILESIPLSSKEIEITLDISGRSFILDGKTYSF